MDEHQRKLKVVVFQDPLITNHMATTLAMPSALELGGEVWGDYAWVADAVYLETIVSCPRELRPEHPDSLQPASPAGEDGGLWLG